MKVTVELPRVGRRRLVFLCVSCSAAAALWVTGAVQLSAPSAMWLHVVIAIAVPFGAGYAVLMAMEYRIARDMVRTAWVPQAEPKLREDLVQR